MHVSMIKNYQYLRRSVVCVLCHSTNNSAMNSPVPNLPIFSWIFLLLECLLEICTGTGRATAACFFSVIYWGWGSWARQLRQTKHLPCFSGHPIHSTVHDHQYFCCLSFSKKVHRSFYLLNILRSANRNSRRKQLSRGYSAAIIVCLDLLA